MTIDSAVVTEVAGVAFTTPAFEQFLNKSCKMLHLKFNFPLIFPLHYPGFKKLSTPLLSYNFLFLRETYAFSIFPDPLIPIGSPSFNI